MSKEIDIDGPPFPSDLNPPSPEVLTAAVNAVFRMGEDAMRQIEAEQKPTDCNDVKALQGRKEE